MDEEQNHEFLTLILPKLLPDRDRKRCRVRGAIKGPLTSVLPCPDVIGAGAGIGEYAPFINDVWQGCAHLDRSYLFPRVLIQQQYCPIHHSQPHRWAQELRDIEYIAPKRTRHMQWQLAECLYT